MSLYCILLFKNKKKNKIKKNLNLSMYIINIIHHGKCMRTVSTHSLVCIRNLTRSLRSLVRFPILDQLVRKYRTHTVRTARFPRHAFHGTLSMKYSIYSYCTTLNFERNYQKRTLCADRRSLSRDTFASRDRFRPIGARPNLALYYNCFGGYTKIFFLFCILDFFLKFRHWPLIQMHFCKGLTDLSD